MPSFRSEYTYRKRWGNPEHTWIVVGGRGAVHLHITDHGEEFGSKYGERYSGGIEIHSRFAPEHCADDAPDHDECWVLKCPCWHDGSSTAAIDFWIPRWLANQDSHDSMFELLQGEYARRFCSDESEVSV